MNSLEKIPIFIALAAIVSVQIGAAFAKSIFPLVGSDGIAALRIGISAVMLFFLLKPYTLSLNKENVIHLLQYGIILGLMNVLIYRSFNYIPVGIAVSLEVLGPLCISVLTSRSLLNLLWVLFAVAGVIFLPMGSVTQSLDYRGVLFALAAAACWGLYILAGKRVAHLGSRSVAIGMATASLFVVPLGLSQVGLALFSPTVLLYGLLVAILSSALPFILEMYALKFLPSNVFGILMSASPAISSIAGCIILKEYLSYVQWLGIIFISIACLGCSVFSLRKSSSSISLKES